MRILSVALVLIHLVAVPGLAFAQAETPPRGSPLRTAILDALRPRAVAEFGAPVEFVIETLNVLGEWAFVTAKPQRTGGGTIPFAYTRYQSAYDAGVLSPRLYALLRNTPDGWLVYEYDFGSTDPAYMPWAGLYPVPPEVFP